ncbi:hypothetical protein CK203_018372 [Vitis vinifera]|uniref:Uncharacterized protein n=1 Tax=Vitis vinifera TaxID=29760 RepID=A0A438JP52_VITVI|nr:hypothetical protein CK203_018372 [Vitis vinifera]
MTPEVIIRRPIEGNLDFRVRPFHFELCFDRETFRHQSELRDSFHLQTEVPFGAPDDSKGFLLSRVALDFYQSMDYASRPGSYCYPLHY